MQKRWIQKKKILRRKKKGKLLEKGEDCDKKKNNDGDYDDCDRSKDRRRIVTRFMCFLFLLAYR
jgi:hypothetical protein